MSPKQRTVAALIVGAFLFAAAAWIYLHQPENPIEFTLDEFETKLVARDITSPVEMKARANEVVGSCLSGNCKDGQGEFIFRYAGDIDEDVANAIRFEGIDVKVVNEDLAILESIVETVLSILPIILLVLLGIVVLFWFLGRHAGRGNREIRKFGKAKTKQVTKESPKVTFDDVAGVDEAVEELDEIKEFLERPEKFRAMGAKIPKGVILYGPPGTGKTLLARAVAGEAGVPFYAISASEFVEMFVGVGASRVRDLFEQAMENTPSIVFIDEIDAIGRRRGAGIGGGHDEREQTLNQLLVELDGFEPNAGVIVLASTNRPDILDPALLRPGRFDRQIVVDRPDVRGREQILDVHAKGKPLGDGISMKDLARQTPGFTGADLANLINEAAILAVRRDKTTIEMSELEEAIERVIAGPERKSRVMSDEEIELTAYHEGGHALAGYALPKIDPIHKVTIIPRGRAGGYTMALPLKDVYYEKRSKLVDELAYTLGGRAAEEIVFGDPSTGATNDIDKATTRARQMVMEFGMSQKVGPVKYGSPEGDVFLGRDYTKAQELSREASAIIDNEVRLLTKTAEREAIEILTVHREALDRIAKELMENETLDAEGIARVLHDVPKWGRDEEGNLEAPSK